MWEFIDKIVYINLAHRKDRRALMEKNVLPTFPADKITRFDAIKNTRGDIGCSMSHIAVLEDALNSGCKNILVLEDDVQWTTDASTYSNALTMIETLVDSGNYDVISLGCISVEYETTSLRLKMGHTTSSYLVNAPYIPTLLANFKEGLTRLLGTETDSDHNYEYTIDSYWMRIMKPDRWYMPVPPPITQRPDYSDIANTNVDRTLTIILKMPPSLCPDLHAGLGNQLFQLAAANHIAKKHNRVLWFDDLQNRSTHSSTSYMSTIFRDWKYLYRHAFCEPTWVGETNMAYETNWERLAWKDHVKLTGYFQDWQYIDADFVKRLHFDTECLSRYPDIKSTVFIHVRGGDYVGNSLHHVDLTEYYPRAIALFPPETKFTIFTNDVEYTKSQPWLKNISYSIVDNESELDSLFLMTQCAGGICANSTFSWWGAYLNPTRQLTLPSAWFTKYEGYVTTGLYFPGSTTVPV
jgi:glycosyl transferase, family 25